GALNPAMKQILLCIALAVGASGQTAAGSAERIAAQQTAGNWNGRFWRSLDHDGKIVFVLAYGSAVQEVTIAQSGGKLDRYKELIKPFWPTGLTGAEIVLALDRFYDTPENGPITISGAIEVIAQRAYGANDAAIEKTIDELRSKA